MKVRKMHFLVKIYRYGGNYSAMVPDLPGCVAAADTVEETRTMLAEAVAIHLEMMLKSGQKIPTPRQSLRFSISEAVKEEFCTLVEVKTPRAAPGYKRTAIRESPRGRSKTTVAR